MNQVRDLDLENHHSWQGALKLLLALCDESADLSFDCCDIGGWKLPSLEVRLDNPAQLRLPQITQEDGVSTERWEHGTVLLAERRPEKLPAGPVWLLRTSGAAAVTYRAFREAARVLQALGLPAEFSWSSLPLAPISADPDLTARREQACWSLGAIHSLWLRCPEDEALKRAMAAMEPCGQLQVQNMTTANTWISGSLRREQLLQTLR